MTTMTIRKANHDRKVIDDRIRQIAEEIRRERKSFIAFYRTINPMIGSLSVDEMTENIKSNWQKINDLIKRRENLNKAVMAANATTMIEVPQFSTLEKTSDKSEKVSLAAAIARKKYYQMVLGSLLKEFEQHCYSIETKFESTHNQLERELNSILNNQFGPASTQSAKARLDYQETIKPQYEVTWIDPLKLRGKLADMRDMLNAYINDIDSLISNATETTQIEVDD